MGRIVDGVDSIEESIYKISDGNPGAVLVISAMMKAAKTASAMPDDRGAMTFPLLTLDDLGIYGSQVYCFWKLWARENAPRAVVLLIGHHMGLCKITPEDLLASEESGAPCPFDVEDVQAKVHAAGLLAAMGGSGL
jgi:hypothetical protein